MAIYDANGNALNIAYNANGSAISTAYDANGNVIYTSGEPTPTPTPTPDPYRDGRVLAWEENFDGDEGDAPDTANWGHEVGRIRSTSERQYYMDGNYSTYLDGESHLVIHARKETMEGKTWTSGSINTNNKYEFTYGRIDAKLKLPYIAGQFPAFWMLGAGLEVVPLGYYDSSTGKDIVEKGIRTPLSPEIDIMEQFGTASTIQSAVHCGSEEDGDYEVQYMPTLAVADTTEWHVYSCEWTSQNLKWYVDDVQVGTSESIYAGTHPAPQSYEHLNRPMFILLNLAIGHKGGTPSGSEMKMYADWVRVYLPVGVIEKYPVTGLTLSDNSISLTVGETEIIDLDFTPSLCWNKTIVWTSSDANVAEVYGGKVYAVGAGTCTITATAHNGITATCAVNVQSV